MDLSRPYSAVTPSLDGEVLRVLVRSNLGLTGREVALLTGRTAHSGVAKVLDRLVQHGLVERVEMNRAYLYSLNREHLATPVVEALMDMRNTLIVRMRELASGWSIPAAHLSLFGSAARGDGDARSDVDLFVIRPNGIPDDDPVWREQLGGLAAKVESWTGNRASFAEVAEPELALWPSRAPAIVDDLRRDAVMLGGKPLGALLAGVA